MNLHIITRHLLFTLSSAFKLKNCARKRPLPHDYPIQFRFDRACGWARYREEYECLFDMSSGLDFGARYNGIKELITTYVWPILEEMVSLDAVERMKKAGKFPPEAIRMPVLAKFDPDMRKRLMDYVFIDGEYQLVE